MAAIEGVGTELADTLFKLGWRSAAEVAGAKPDELASVAGIGSAEAAKTDHRAAARAAEIERKQQAEEMARWRVRPSRRRPSERLPRRPPAARAARSARSTEGP